MAANKRPVFTSEDDVFILRHYNMDMTAKQIGAARGRNRNSVITRYQFLIGRRYGSYYVKRGFIDEGIRPTPSMPKLKFLGEV